MASRKDALPDEEMPSVQPIGPANIQDRILAFMMLDAMGADATQAQKCVRLALAGFRYADIAAMLQTTTATVTQNVYAERKKLKGGTRSQRGSAAKAKQ